MAVAEERVFSGRLAEFERRPRDTHAQLKRGEAYAVALRPRVPRLWARPFPRLGSW